MAAGNKKTSKTAKTANVKTVTRKTTGGNSHKVVVKKASQGVNKRQGLTEKEKEARRLRKIAVTSTGFGSRMANMGGYGGGDTAQSSGGSFYSPQLSTDFLEKPQNLRERRAWYRHFYNSNEFVGQAIDLHSTLPLSKIQLGKPKCKNPDQADYIYTFFTDMCDRIKLFKTLIEISHDFNLIGNVFAYAEEFDPYAPRIGDEDPEESRNKLEEEGAKQSKWLHDNFKVVDKDPNYKGWRRIAILPPDQVRLQKVPFSDISLIEYIPDPATKDMIMNSMSAKADDSIYEDLKEKTHAEVPNHIIYAVQEGGAIPLDTDPFSGSFCYHMARKKSQYEQQGTSVLERCVNTLLLHDKLRQAQTQIASRHMTPIRVVWGENLSDIDVENLREQVDQALIDPDFSIIANYQINWEEFGVNDRLLQLDSEYEHHENALFAGLGVTRELLTGESTYSGNRITLEILNTQYLLFREMLQEYVEEYLFKPVAYKKGFVETDKFGREKVIFPRLKFTRLAIKDNDTFFDQVFQLYNKGSVSIDIILDMFNIDAEETRDKIKADLMTVNDAAFQDLPRAIYNAAGASMVEQTNIVEKLAEYMGFDKVVPPEGEGGEGGADLGGGGARFANTKKEKAAESDIADIIKLAKQSPDKLRLLKEYLKSPNGGNHNETNGRVQVKTGS